MHADLDSRRQARDLLARARRAFDEYRSFTQSQVDRICHAMVEAGFAAAEALAQLAVEETGMGRVDGKVAKNRFATRGLWAHIHDMKTCGLIASRMEEGVHEYADPFGVIAAVIPTTNPTSTAMFKAIIALKSRNAIVVSPHPRARHCTARSIEILKEAAVGAGAPEGLLSCMTQVTLAGTEELMQHQDSDLILATGSSGLVKAAYSSGKPAFGVGPGNTPAWIDRSADPAKAARCIVDSQTFDNGTICASEQALVVDSPVMEPFLSAMKALGAHLCSAEESRKLGDLVARGPGGMNPDVVGLAPARLAEMAGFPVAEDTTVLLAFCDGVGPEHKLSREKLCPILALFERDGWEAGCSLCIEILRYGGLGHTLVLHCEDEHVIHTFAEKKPVNRILVNSPSSQGAVGYATNLEPSMTLGCGSFGGNITSDNIGPRHLLNIKRLAWVVPDYHTSRGTESFVDVGCPLGVAAGENDRAASCDRTLWQPRREKSSRGGRPQVVSGAGHRRSPGEEEELRRLIAGLLKESDSSADLRDGPGGHG